VADDQQGLVADNAISIAQAYFATDARFRAIYADEEAVGFIMWSEKPEKPQYFLWRLMIDHRFQRFGFGRRAVEFLIEHIRAQTGATELLVSAVPGDNSPIPFYEGMGFESMDRYEGDELVMRFVLDDSDKKF
jgi:diamine N-acetyltransferase